MARISEYPSHPEPRDGQAVRTSFEPRYEDVTQTGRLVLPGLAAALGEAVWRNLIRPSPVASMMRTVGIVPILRRMVAETPIGPFSPTSAFDVDAAFRLAHQPTADPAADTSAEAERLFVLMWIDMQAGRGTAYAPPERDAPRVRAGSLFAEHVVTRIFGEKHERRVRRFDIPGLPAVPEDTYVMPEAERLLELPGGGAWLADRPCDGAHTFSVSETDSNQHVNSLVYPRIADEHARRALEHGGRQDAWTLDGARLEICWRKPLFAGDSVVLSARPWALDGAVGAWVRFDVEGETRPRAIAELRYDTA